MNNFKNEFNQFIIVTANGDINFAYECIEKFAESLKILVDLTFLLIEEFEKNKKEDIVEKSVIFNDIVLKVHNAAGNAGLMGFYKINTELLKYELILKKSTVNLETIYNINIFLQSEHEKFCCLSES